MFLRSPSGTSSSMVRSSFSTFRLSPVSALSLIFQAGIFNDTAVGAHRVTGFRKTISPTVTSRDEITTLFRPAELCRGRGDLLQAGQGRMFRFDLLYCAKMAFIITARMTAALSISFRTMDTAAAAIRISTRKSLNCSKDNKDRFFCPLNQFIVPVFLTPFLDLF